MDNENNKCSAYEGYFIFSDETRLKAHLEVCPDCREENEKHLKVSALLKEAAPAYLERENKRGMIKAARRLACCLIVFAGLSAFTGYRMYYNNDAYINQTNNSVFYETESIISEMGLPSDEYGFLAL